MFFFKKKKDDNLKLSISRVNLYYYNDKIYYGHRSFLGHTYRSDVINVDNVNILFDYFYNCLINNVSAGKNAGASEEALWIKASENQDVFDNIVINKASQSYMDKTYERDGVKFYLPFHIGMFDCDSVSEYHIVMIDNEFELRQTDYHMIKNGLGIKDVIDKHKEITSPDVILKMENTILTALRLIEIKKDLKKLKKEECKKYRKLYELLGLGKSVVNKTVDMIEDDILEPLDQKDIVCYIDWKLEFDDVLYNINRLLSKRKLKKISVESKKLYGEEAFYDCQKCFHNDEYLLSRIDIGSDGFYICLIRICDKEDVMKELEAIGCQYND
ncbi:MAG: hypothetical protein RR630_04705 [Coprobacillus sp.]